MTDFEITLRQRCRNPHCRMKLPVPTANEKEAFCTRGCFTSFYLNRCIICEEPFKRVNETQRVCKKADCRRAWKAQIGLGRYIGSLSIRDASESPDFIGPKEAIKSDRPWRQIACSPPSPSAFRGATIPNGQNGWAGGEYLRVEAKNQAAMRAAELAAVGHFADPEWREVISPDGVRCFITGNPPPTTSASSTRPPIPDDLSIPDFLRRRPQ